MARIDKFKRGMQVLYVPPLAESIEDWDVEAGFVTSVGYDMAFCRFWSKSHPDELRTKANSEATPLHLLVIKNTRPQEQVEAALEQWC